MPADKAHCRFFDRDASVFWGAKRKEKEIIDGISQSQTKRTGFRQGMLMALVPYSWCLAGAK